MIITDSAKELILKVLEEDQKNVVKIEIIKQGCHGQLYLDTIISNDYELINDVPIQINQEDKEYLENITFDTKNGNLVFTVAGGCGCGGCGGDCEGTDEGCCSDGGCCGCKE